MKKFLSFLIFVVIAFSIISPISSDENILYKLDEDYLFKDISFDQNLNNLFLAGEIKGSNNSFIIKSKDGNYLREVIIDNFKVSKIINDKFSSVYAIGASEDNQNKIIKFTSGLNKRWETKIHFSDMDIITSFIVNENQEVIVIGYSTFKRSSDSFIIRINQNGEIISEKILDISPYERPYKIIEDYGGNFYLTGESKDMNFDIFVCKLSNDFDVLWIDYYDNNNWVDGGLGLELVDGNLIAAGYSGKEGWYVFDTVFIEYSKDGNVTSFTRKSFSGGSDWVKEFKRNNDHYYLILIDLLTGKEYSMKLDYYFDVVKKVEISKDEIPIKIIKINNDIYFVFQKENVIFAQYL